MVTPFRYGRLNPSTNTRMPLTSRTMSSSTEFSSMFRLYLNPLQPPGRTATRRPAVAAGTSSALMNLRISPAAASVRVMAMPVSCCVLLIIWLPVQGSRCGPAERLHNRTGMSTNRTLCDGDRPVRRHAPERTEAGVVPGRVNPVGEEHHHQVPRRVQPDRGPGEPRVAKALRREAGSGAASGGGCIPPEGAAGTANHVALP